MKAKRLLLIPALPVLAVCVFVAAPALSASKSAKAAASPTQAAASQTPTAVSVSDTQAAVSENWAGYAVGGTDTTSTSFSDVSGSWVVPTATCTSGEPSYSAFWVGLGGASENSDALEQAGTQSDCGANGQATYYAWYELVPAAPVKLSMTVSPGDKMSSKVSVSGDSVAITVTDATTGASVTKQLTTSSIDTSSAEWIAEAPSECTSAGDCQPLSLADFGKVTFTSASATANGHTGTISDSDWAAQPVELSPASGEFYGGGPTQGGFESSSVQSSGAGATPSVLVSGGSSFSVSYDANATADTAGRDGAASSGSASAGGYGTDPGDGDGGGYGYGGYGAGGYGYGGGYGGYGGGYAGGYGGYGGYGGGYGGYGAAAYGI